ncbi:hypothetical protein HNY73_015635 [Argiope bruennichi]|uniref:Uncharacterized protein n=1 Tax=Argiope bruennichi TaxID=94029 RepID=A0A8T0EU87_ARGBR|nr:hypothetical protein HNY73_015635 [Argiope bruennichi]
MVVLVCRRNEHGLVHFIERSLKRRWYQQCSWFLESADRRRKPPREVECSYVSRGDRRDEISISMVFSSISPASTARIDGTLQAAAIIPSAISANFSAPSSKIARICCTFVGRYCRKKDLSKLSEIRFPALLPISNKRRQGFRSPSCIPEMKSRRRCSSLSEYCEHSRAMSVVYGFSAGGLKIR